MESKKLPRENLYRAAHPAVEIRAAEESSGGMPVLHGHFSVFNQWTEINSAWEGRFLERVAPGAFAKTFQEQRDSIRVLFQHGRDPQIGDKPLGPLTDLREDEVGGYYEVPLLDAAYTRELVPGLEAGLYGASFRFSVMREDFIDNPEPSAANPKGLPERTIREARVAELGPVTFGAYPAATAGVRSITDLIHDVDAMTRATPILLDEERLNRAVLFVTRSIPAEPAVEAEAEPEGEAEADEQEAGDHPAQEVAPSPSDAAPIRSHLAGERRESGHSHLLPRKREGASNLL